MTNQAQIPVIAVTSEDLQRYRENNGELGFNPNGVPMESPNFVLKDFTPEAKELILDVVQRFKQGRENYEEELNELQNLYDNVSSFSRGSPYLRDMIRAMASTLGYNLTTLFNIPREPSTEPYQSYRTHGINRINNIADYTKCILTFLVDHWHQTELNDLSYTYRTIHQCFHQARIDFGYGDIYIDLTEKDTLRITGMYNSTENGQVVRPFISFKLNEKELVVKRG